MERGTQTRNQITMKNLFIAFVLIAICACKRTQSTPLPDAEWSEYPDVQMQYRNHNYYVWISMHGVSAVVHDPDCPCHNKKRNNLKGNES